MVKAEKKEGRERRAEHQSNVNVMRTKMVPLSDGTPQRENLSIIDICQVVRNLGQRE